MAKIVEVTNPITGQPTQVDQLDHTAQQIDDAIARALPGGYYDKWVSQLVNPNLLDNPYFGNPVDQRGGYVVPPGVNYYGADLNNVAGTTTSYLTARIYAAIPTWAYIYVGSDLYYVQLSNCVRGYTGAGDGIDRWKAVNSCTILIEEEGLNLTGKASGIFQPLDAVIHKDTKVTFSVFYKGTVTLTHYGAPYLNVVKTSADWNVASYTYVIPAGTDLRNSFYCPIFGNGTVAETEQTTADAYVLALKLELGDHQTLAHQDENGNWVLNEIPDYGEQLARCKRVYQRISSNGLIVLRQSNIPDRFVIIKSFEVEMAGTPKLNLIKPITVFSPATSSLFQGIAIDGYVTNSKGIQYAKIVSSVDLSNVQAGFVGYGDNNDDVIEAYVEGLGG